MAQIRSHAINSYHTLLEELPQHIRVDPIIDDLNC
jgi:hypothetical protein